MNIAIITSNDFYRESLKTALNQIPRFTVNMECRSSGEVLRQIAGRPVDVVLVNRAVCADDPDGFIKQIRLLSPGARILMLLEYPEECWRSDAIRSGADDALPQSADKKKLERHIRKLTPVRQRRKKKQN